MSHDFIISVNILLRVHKRFCLCRFSSNTDSVMQNQQNTQQYETLERPQSEEDTPHISEIKLKSDNKVIFFTNIIDFM